MALPGAQIYRAESLHLTVVVPIPAGQPADAPAEWYVPAARAAVAGIEPFMVEGRGIGIASGSLVLWGFPMGPTLSQLRARVRGELARLGLPNNEGDFPCYDGRGRPRSTAHVTLARLDPSTDVAAERLAAVPSFRSYLRVDRVDVMEHDHALTPGISREVARITLGYEKKGETENRL